MTPSVSKKPGRVYRYYVCGNATKTGWENCPCPSLPARDIEARGRQSALPLSAKTPGWWPPRSTRSGLVQKSRQPQLVAERRQLDRELTRLKDGGRLEDQEQIGRLEVRQSPR
jgi:hypothetical protein